MMLPGDADSFRQAGASASRARWCGECAAGLARTWARNQTEGRRRLAAQSASLHSSEHEEAQRYAARAPDLPMDNRVPVGLGELEGRESPEGPLTSLTRGQA